MSKLTWKKETVELKLCNRQLSLNYFRSKLFLLPTSNASTKAMDGCNSADIES